MLEIQAIRLQYGASSTEAPTTTATEIVVVITTFLSEFTCYILTIGSGALGAKMFSAFKKLGASSTKPDAAVAGTVPMSGSLQKKFARGVQYNSEYLVNC